MEDKPSMGRLTQRNDPWLQRTSLPQNAPLVIRVFLVATSAVMGLGLCCTAGCGGSRGRQRKPKVVGREGPGLHWAAVMGDVAHAERLLDAGADVNEVDSHGRATPLGVAADSGSIDMVRLLLDRGADVNKACPLLYASLKGNLKIVELLLERGADPNRFRIGTVPSPLLAAAEAGHLDTVKMLVAHGSELGIRDSENSPLKAAAAYGHTEVVEFLVAESEKTKAPSATR